MSNPTLITFVIYIAAMILIGFTAYRATKNFDDYILGGRSIGSFVTALSAGASDMSGWLLMGLPGAIFVAGLSESWIAIGLIAGAWLNWLFVAGRLRVHTEHNHNALTLPDYFSHRFEDHSRLLRPRTRRTSTCSRGFPSSPSFRCWVGGWVISASHTFWFASWQPTR